MSKINYNRIKYCVEVRHEQSFVDENGGLYEKDFFDRDDSLQEVISAFEDQGATFVFLRGERRIGKSSLLLRIAGEFKNREEACINAVITQGEAPAIKSYAQWVAKMIAAIHNAVDQLQPTDMEHFTTVSPEELVDKLYQFFHSGLVGMCLVTFDEIEASTSQMSEQDRLKISRLFKLLNSACRSVANPLPMRFLMSGVRTPRGLSLPSRFFTTVRVRPFPIPDLDVLINWILDGDEDAISSNDRERCHELTGDWPFFLQWLFYTARIRTPGLEEGWPEIVLTNAVEDSTLGEVLAINYEDNFGGKEKTLLLLEAQWGGVKPEHLDRLDEGSRDEQPFHRAADRLVDRGYLKAMPNLDYKATIGVMSYWLRHWREFSAEYQMHCQPILK